MTDLVEGKDYGKFADGTPWVRWNAIDKLRRNPPVTKKITAKIAHFIVKRLGKQISDEITKQRREAAVSEISPETIAHVHNDDDEDDGKKRAKKCDQLIKFYMSQGDSFDVAASKAHWDEQAAKAQSDQSSHNGENARAERRMTGENLNPRPLSP